jgi:hypothetical protein
MLKQGRPLSAATKGILAAVAVSAMLGLAACGSAVAGGPARSGSSSAAKKSAVQPGGTMIPAAAGAGVPLCVHIPSLVKVTFMRSAGMRDGRHLPVPAFIVMKNGTEVRRLATILCSLPLMPSVVNCPANFGTSYRLAFATAKQGFPIVTVQTSGCRTVSGLGKTRWWARSPQVGDVIRRTMGAGSTLLPPHQGSVPTP